MHDNTKTILTEANKTIDKAIENARLRRIEDDQNRLVASIGGELVRILTLALALLAAFVIKLQRRNG